MNALCTVKNDHGNEKYSIGNIRKKMAILICRHEWFFKMETVLLGFSRKQTLRWGVRTTNDFLGSNTCGKKRMGAGLVKSSCCIVKSTWQSHCQPNRDLWIKVGGVLHVVEMTRPFNHRFFGVCCELPWEEYVLTGKLREAL